MPDGFVGTPAGSYLGDVDIALVTAEPIHSRDPFQNLSNRAVPPPGLPARPNKQSPHPPDTAKSGGHTTGSGSSSNIVVGEGEYDAIKQKIDQIDEAIGQELYNIAAEIEALCNGAYVLPKAVPKCLLITMGIKSSMGNFRSMTAEAVIKLQGFVRGIMAIG